jgi:hypothetical protein
MMRMKVKTINPAEEPIAEYDNMTNDIIKTAFSIGSDIVFLVLLNIPYPGWLVVTCMKDYIPKLLLVKPIILV